MSNDLPKWLHHFVLWPEMNESSYCFLFSSAFVESVLDFGYSHRCMVIFNYFNLQIPNDIMLSIISYANLPSVYLLWWGKVSNLIKTIKPINQPQGISGNTYHHHHIIIKLLKTATRKIFKNSLRKMKHYVLKVKMWIMADLSEAM